MCATAQGQYLEYLVHITLVGVQNREKIDDAKEIGVNSVSSHFYQVLVVLKSCLLTYGPVPLGP